MVDERRISARNVVDLAMARALRQAQTAAPMRAMLCRHCGAALGDGETDDDCSSAGYNALMPASATMLRVRRAE